MNENSERSGNRSWLGNLLILILMGGLFLAIAIPNFTNHRTSKLNVIINNLRQIDAAKNQWAFEHGVTNFDQIAKLTNQLSERDLSQFLPPSDKQGGLISSVAGEIYEINALNKSPDAKLVNKIDMPWPKGSIIRFSEHTNVYLEIIFPDGTKTYF
jgi:hypothetical protein